jgi:hypothetical protein
MDNLLHTFTGVPAGEIAARLAEPFNDPLAYKGVPGGADLTDISTGFMLERVTQVFGPKGLGWNFLFERADLQLLNPGEKRVLAHLKYAVFQYTLFAADGQAHTCEIPTSGVNANSIEYAEEGARTSALGAALKGLCFQLPVYKGQLDHHNAARLISGNGKSAKAETPKVAPQPEPEPAPHGNGGAQPGEFVVGVGAKYRGKRVDELADNVLAWFANLDGKGFSPQSAEGQAAQYAVRKYLDLRRIAA